MKSILTKFLAAATLGMACYAAEVQFRYTLLVNDLSVADSSFVFGRATDASDGIDDLDIPAIPVFDGGGLGNAPVEDFYFRAQASSDANNDASNAFSKLYTDIRSTNMNANTWTLCTNSNGVALSWKGQYYMDGTTINSALPANAGTLALYDSNDNVLVADMRTTTSYSLAANSVYNIKYISANATAAPETPEEISKFFVIWDGSVLDFKILDAEKYALVDWTLNYYNGTERLVGKEIKKSDNVAYANYDNGVFTYEHPANFDAEFTEFRLEYTFKYNTRAGNDGTATGMLRAVRSIEPIMELFDDCKELSINVKGTDAEKSCGVSYCFKVDADYQKTMTSNLVLVGTFTLPPWTYRTGMENCPWVVSIWSNEVELDETTAYTVTHSIPKSQWKDGDVITTSGVFTADKPLLVISPDDELKDFIIALDITGDTNCKSGTVTFAGSFVNVDGETIVLPKEDEPADALTATLKVKGLANLDIDESDNGTKYVLTDVRLLYNYINGGKASNPTGDTRMLAGTTYKTLTGNQKVETAAKFREKIGDMIDSLDIDSSDNGSKYVLADVRLIYNYINGGKASNATGDTRMLAGTTYKTLTGDQKAQKAAEFRAKIADMLD